MINNIPAELKQLRQWVVASGVPTPQDPEGKQPLNPNTGFAASVVDPSTWGTFEQALATGQKHIGFVLSKDDPYTIIDLDDPRKNSQKDWETNADVVALRTARHGKILNMFQSYTELSQSGQGMHIIVRGVISKGCRRDKVEVYSDSRYMICTGNVYNGRTEITNQQELLDILFKEMLPVGREDIELVQVDSDLSDENLLRMAGNAVNAEKFRALWLGQWQGNPLYPSQSEADFALLSMLCFYTDDNAQVRRMFRTSALGQREKAVRNDVYINYALRKIRAEQARQAAAMGKVDFSALLLSAKTVEQQVRVEREEQEQAITAQAETNTETFYPPGFVGELAKYFYSASIRPVPEISLVAALGFCAGILGRQFQISGTGLNLYMVLIAGTGTGKEAISTNIDRMINAVRKGKGGTDVGVPSADRFVGPRKFGSAPGLVGNFEVQKCFVSVLTEFGILFEHMSGVKASSNDALLRSALMEMYTKSAEDAILRPTVRSNKENNTKLVQAPSLSLVGETTPSTFYDKLTGASLADGSLPRFIFVEYTGPRTKLNEHAGIKPPALLLEHASNMICSADSMERDSRFQTVARAEDANEALLAFNTYCDDKINSTKNEAVQQIWTRAYMNSLKVAALISVANRQDQATVNLKEALWAIQFVKNAAAHLASKFINCEVGSGNGRQESDLVRAIKDWLIMDPKARLTYMNNKNKGTLALAETSLLPYCYLLRRARRCTSFTEDRRDVDAALTAIVKTMTQSGKLEQLDIKDTFAKFGLRSAIFRTSELWEATN